MEVIGGVSGVLAIVGVVAKCAKKLNEIKDSYDSVALNIQLAAIQLATIRDALEAIAEWRLSSHTENQASKNLDATLAESLKGCAVLITVIDGKLGEAGYAPGVKRKIRHLWLEDVLKGYMSNLDGQVRALQLLLTSFQCRTVTEQIQRLQRAEAQSVFQQVRADTASLTVGNKDLEDAASVLSFDPSVSFDMDEIILEHPAYKAAYGNRVPPLPPRPSQAKPPSTASSPTQAHVQIPQITHEDLPTRFHDDLSNQEDAQAEARQDQPLHETAKDSTKVDEQAVKPVRRESSRAHVPRKPMPAVGRAHNVDSPKAEDPSLVSAVEALNREIQSAFDDAPRLENRDTAAQDFTSGSDADKSDRNAISQVEKVENKDPRTRVDDGQSDGEGSDLDEMISMLPLASHFNISRKAMNPGKPPRRLSTDSNGQEIRKEASKDSGPDFLDKSDVAPPAVLSETTPKAITTEAVIPSQPIAGIDDALAVDPVPDNSRPPSMSEPLSAQSVNNRTSIDARNPRDSERRISTDSDLYTSSVTEKPDVAQEIGRHTSTESNTDPSDIVGEQNPISNVLGSNSNHPEAGERAQVESLASSDVDGNTNNNAFPLPSRTAARDMTKAVSTFTNGDTDPPPAPQREPPALPRPPSSHPDSSDNLERPSKLTESTASVDRMDVSPLKKPKSTNSLRRAELTSSEYIKYSNTEQHGLKIILTPDSGVKPKSPITPSFTVPPRRPPPSAPSASSRSFSTLTPSNSLSLGRRSSNESAQSRYTMAGVLSSSPTEQDESINETSTVSSSDRSDRQTLSSPVASDANTIATTFSHPPDSLRGQAQNDLHKLQIELAAAKSRGDTSAQKASLQRSMDIIQKTYLTSSATKSVESGTKVGSPPKSKGNRISLMPKKSMSVLNMVKRKSRQADLHEAVRTGDNDTLRSLLEDKIDVNARGDRFKTPQMEAAMRSHLHCLQTLKEFGADEFAVDGQGRTALHMAVVSNQPKAVAWLIEAYPPAAPDIPGKKSSKLAWAADAITGSRSSKILREAADGEGLRALHIAAKLALPGMVMLLLNHGSDIDAMDNWGRTPLTAAAILNRREIVDLLLDRAADLTTKDVNGMTPLHWAAKNNHLGVLQSLLTKCNARFLNQGGPKEWYDKQGDLPIHSAAREGHIEPVRLLRDGRQFSDIHTKHGETLVHITTLANQLSLTKELLQPNVNVNAWAKPHSYHLRLFPKNDIEYSPKALPLPYNILALHYSCTRGYYEMTELLLENGAWVNAPPDDDEHGKSPLMMAVESGSTDLVCLLLARGAKVNAAVPATLVTSLHIASKQGDLETARELVRYGAKTASRTKDLKTPEELISKIKDTKKRIAMETYFAELTRQRFAKIKAQMAQNRQQNGAPSLTPQPSPAVMQQQVTTSMYTTEFMDPENDAFPDAPPAYTPGPNAPRNLANRPGVYRPQYG